MASVVKVGYALKETNSVLAPLSLIIVGHPVRCHSVEADCRNGSTFLVQVTIVLSIMPVDSGTFWTISFFGINS